MAELTAVTRRLDGEVDLLSVAGHADGVAFVRGGVGMAGRGEASRVGRGDVADFLGTLAVDDEVGLPGCGPVAFAALPFAPGGDADFVVPEIVVGHDGNGTRWVTRVSADGAPAHPAELAVPPTDLVEPSRFRVEPAQAPEAWRDAVASATARIGAGELDKVVLARTVAVDADRPFPVPAVLRRLRAAFGDCYVYGIDGFVGASPELLVGRHGDVVQAHPMAGTTARRGDPQADARAIAALLASPTYRHEHQVTIDAVHDTLLRFCSYLDDEPEPSVVTLANVAHLATRVEGRLSTPPASVLELVAALHPTPAVCGRPRDRALALIAELEGFDRGRYAGAVGWVDADGNGQWAVSIRCAQLEGSRALVYAGNGIVGSSDPATELEETRAKLQAMLSALVRP